MHTSDRAYFRWKRFKTSELFSAYRILKNKVNLEIKKVKTKYHENKFNETIDNQKTWSAIREISMCNKACDSHNSIDINDLNEKFCNIPAPAKPCNYYKNYTPPVRIKNTFNFFSNY